MTEAVTYYRRTENGLVVSKEMADVFTPWNVDRECWMFVSPHDDDILIGAGLTFQAALASGVEVHAVATTDGRMGYCRPGQQRTIVRIREAETRASFAALGLPPDRLQFLHFPDGNLYPYIGRRFTALGDPTEMEGASGLQNSYVAVMRKLRPTRLFLPTITDLHPDHRIVHKELLISMFHAQGEIWPELGEPIPKVPAVYEYATYCDFLSPPQIRVAATQAMLDAKLRGIAAFASQEQIEAVVDVQRRIGPIEYLRDVEFHFYSPEKYDKLFAEGR